MLSGTSGSSTITGHDKANALGPVIYGINCLWFLMWSLISADGINGCYSRISYVVTLLPSLAFPLDCELVPFSISLIYSLTFMLPIIGIDTTKSLSKQYSALLSNAS